MFTEIKFTDGWEKKKKKFSVISFRKLLIFPIWAFPENPQSFVGAFLSQYSTHMHWGILDLVFDNTNTVSSQPLPYSVHFILFVQICITLV